MVPNPFQLNRYVSPACLPSQDFIITNGIGVISGFGLTEVCFKYMYEAISTIMKRVVHVTNLVQNSRGTREPPKPWVSKIAFKPGGRL